MNIIIDGYDFWNMSSMKYWSHPKSYDQKKKREEAKLMCLSGDYCGARKMDGAWNMIIKDMDGNFHMRSRTESVNGGFTNKAEWVPQIIEDFASLPNGTVLLGEIYFPNNEGSRKITSVLNCLKDKCLERQEKGDKLHFYIFDVLAFGGINIMNRPFSYRITEIFSYIKNNIKGEYVEIAEYKNGQELWGLYGKVIAEGGEGIVITKKDYTYCPGKRTARKTLKMKKEINETIDAFLDGNYKPATVSYSGKEIETWHWWQNTKTLEKVNENKFNEYTNGETWEPITKAHYYGWASAVSFSVMKDGKPEHIAWISGITDEMKKDIVEKNDELKGKVYELSAMEIEKIEDNYSLRHGKIIQERTDKRPEDCDFSQISSKT